MIAECMREHEAAILRVVNDAAEAYRGVIPADCWNEPYMPANELRDEIAAGVVFLGYWHEAGELAGVIGLQTMEDVCLIRHAYVARTHQHRGIGSALLAALRDRAKLPLLVGTWAAAEWAIDFYRKHGFELTAPDQKDALLARYWSVPARQVENSVVLAERRWFNERGGGTN